MVNECVGCEVGYKKRKRDDVDLPTDLICQGSFHFPVNNDQ